MRTEHSGNSIAYFISPHGFGHAARAAAVISALQDIHPALHAAIFTSVPSWFFEDSLNGPWSYHPLVTDVGLVQESPLRADLPRTIQELDHLLPFQRARLRALAAELDRLGCSLVICDIAPMGIAAAGEAGLPSLLVENFTWDWVYEEYAADHEGLRRHAKYLGALFDRADYHVQAEPVCRPKPVDLTVPPVGRRVRTHRSEVRKRLGIPSEARMVLLTMGGVREDYRGMERLSLPKDVFLVVPGLERAVAVPGHLIPLSHRSPFFHPDLVSAADAVVGKVGYSTVAEVYHAGIPFGFIKRRNFRESDLLAAYIAAHMSGLPIDEAAFASGEWTSGLPRLLEMPRMESTRPNGAARIAAFISALLESIGSRGGNL